MSVALTLPSTEGAKLPATYEAAQAALAECYRIDECKDWADKAAALASYAKQIDDNTLLDKAQRIHGRAIRRAGELLREIQPAKGGRPTEREEFRCNDCGETFGAEVWHCPDCDHHYPDEECGNCHRKRPRGVGSKPVEAPPQVSRSTAAHEAGLSRDQKVQALRVAAIPVEEFEEQIEASPAPTVTALAERGKKTQPKVLHDLGGRSPADFRICTEAIGFVRDLHAYAVKTDVAAVVRGASGRERERFVEQLPLLLGWFNDLLLSLQKEKSK